MIKPKFLHLFLLVISISCKSINMDITTIYLKEFDLFKLKGTQIKVKKFDNEYVKVKLNKGFPIEITFYKSKRNIKIVFEDSFKYNNQTVYLFSTTNLLGGKQGKVKVYSTHQVANKYQLFINKSDTILVKYFDAIDAKDNNYWYSIYLYKRINKDAIQSKLVISEDLNGDQKQNIVLNYSTSIKHILSLSNKGYEFNYSSFPPE